MPGCYRGRGEGATYLDKGPGLWKKRKAGAPVHRWSGHRNRGTPYRRGWSGHRPTGTHEATHLSPERSTLALTDDYGVIED